MNSMRLVEREKRVLAELEQLVTRRAESAQGADAAFRAGQKSAMAEYDHAMAQAESGFRADQAAIDRILGTTRHGHTTRWQAESRAIEESSQDAVQRLVNDINRAERRAHKAVDEARWLARTVYDASRKRQSEHIAEVQQQLRSRLRTARAVESEAIAWLQRLGQQSVIDQVVAEEPANSAGSDSAQRLPDALETAKTELQRLRALGLPGYVHGAAQLWIFAAIAAAIAPAAAWLSDGNLALWIVPTVGLTVVVGTGLTIWLRAVARRQTVATFRPLLGAVRATDAASRESLEQAVAAYRRKRAEIRHQRDAEYRRATEEHAPTLAACRTRREVDLPKITAEADKKLLALQQNHDEEVRQASELAARQSAEVRLRYEQALAAAHGAKERALVTNQGAFERVRSECLRAWQTGFADAQAELAAIGREVESDCPRWDTVIAGGWRPPRSVPTALRFGQLTLDLRDMAGPSLAEPSDTAADDFVFQLPALLDFPRTSSVYVKTHGAGRQRAIELFQVVMLRMLTAVPPGKLRLTIVDPVGLGQNFASFMHLADHDESLVSHRIWTEPAQIEQRLSDLTEHIETVIQKYLRNEFPTIEAYNDAAGEVAEAFRVLVVANFPAGFTEAAARRLLSIAESGPRCGVQLLISVDTKLPPVPGISMADLQKHATVFTTTGEPIAWHDPVFKDLPLVVDESPAEAAKQILHVVGAAAQTAKRVEVPFEAIAPADEAYWKADSRRGIDVPLGRAGATRLQHLRLGQGTSQHVLIAGKTGSGKSTLLHALITNAALRYSPDELELYLIDFKKGVEFKTYVTHELPHARVIAIESEREFGLSVMQRLDAEMRLRGERFREAGVQDIAGYRDAGQPLPRILFIVDEFQEFFVEDDKVAQEASLLLDRLVRQGRAFGIHVHLGSQTLGGAYSLARTTLGQMAVRIALQCSEADAHLILSEENSAARLLSRPGEAIYNDANGLIEGNHPFQVVWLPDDRRDVFLDEVTRLAVQRPTSARRQQIVFEGTRPADLEKSDTVAGLLTGAGATAGRVPSGCSSAGGFSSPSATSAPRIWLGEPLAISEATSATFARRGGANLLMVGQNAEAAAGMFLASAISLAAQFPFSAGNGHADAQLTILNGAPADNEQTALWRRLSSGLGHRVKVTSANDTAALMAELAAEVERRQTSAAELVPRFLFVFDLPRLRELKRQEDDFSFSRSAETARRPDQQFADLLRDGPPLGMHTIIWCDSLTNFQRMLERQTLKEFDTRVLLQMSPADSSLLMDSPAASTLGRHRALLHREDEGRLEKFRPFSPPSERWLALACEQITKHARSAEPVSPARERAG
jgi:S-DNA-T family DNA segregation ATPase FtsK/SpoIIIE